jgi:hypothetical protein
MGLWSDFLTNQDRVIHKWKHYFPIYDRHSQRDSVNTDVVFIEIGCGQGGSLQMWKRFFGPYARIVGTSTRLALTSPKISIRSKSELAISPDDALLRQCRGVREGAPHPEARAANRSVTTEPGFTAETITV